MDGVQPQAGPAEGAEKETERKMEHAMGLATFARKVLVYLRVSTLDLSQVKGRLSHEYALLCLRLYLICCATFILLLSLR